MINQLGKNLKQFKLITFDVTDTLLRFKNSPGYEYARAARNIGYPTVDVDKANQTFRTHFKSMIQSYPNFGRDHSISWENWWRTLVAKTMQSIDAKIPASDVRIIGDTLIDRYETSECWLKDPSADQLIDAIKSAGTSVGIISNFDPRLKYLVANMELPAFDFILASYEVGASKPDPKIFDLAVRMCPQAIVDCKQALHIGNTATLDYLAAREADWHSVLITNGSDEWQAQHGNEICADHVYCSLTDFLYKLENSEIKW